MAEQGRENILKLHLYSHQLLGENEPHFPMRHIGRVERCSEWVYVCPGGIQVALL